MKKGLVIFVVLTMSLSQAFAHRLNEYLQATIISITPTRLLLEIRLTAGTDVAPMILRGIDVNGDQKISKTEEQDYVKQLTSGLTVILDKKNISLNVSAWTFPDVKNFLMGTGNITVNYEIAIDIKNQIHHLNFRNKHISSSGVYLVNCHLPTDGNIQVLGQNRNIDQSSYQLKFSTFANEVFNNASEEQRTGSSDQLALVKTYFVYGIKHILTGYDHLLFLCALVLGASSMWELIKVVTVFTIAHSITLTLATFGLAHLSEQIIEPLIALSIIYVAVQNIAWPKQASGYNRLAIAFFFGLFHGLGFAGGLLGLMHGMPHALIVLALIGFSLGVEAGNQLVLLPLYASLKALERIPPTEKGHKRLFSFKKNLSAGVAIAGIYYFFINLTVGIGL